jgi:hypothetical protein
MAKPMTAESNGLEIDAELVAEFPVWVVGSTGRCNT